jgi:hypothetical protein
MLRTPLAIRELLQQAGYVWDADVDGWHRRDEKVGPLQGRILDATIARTLTRKQVTAWIKAGESDAG